MNLHFTHYIFFIHNTFLFNGVWRASVYLNNDECKDIELPYFVQWLENISNKETVNQLKADK